MMRYVMPIILIGISVAVFFVFTNPFYNDVSQLRDQVASYNGALSNSKALENERDQLTKKKNSMKPENLTKLQKLLPENIDNIRLILEIEQIASPYNMVLKDIKYDANTDTKDTTAKVTTSTPVAKQGGASSTSSSSKDYGVWNLSFSTTGSYANFLNFTRDLETNLRIVDVSSISFSSNASTSGGVNVSASSPSLETYTYNFQIKTYWLKN